MLRPLVNFSKTVLPALGYVTKRHNFFNANYQRWNKNLCVTSSWFPNWQFKSKEAL
jgi:hypothetical protein